MHYLAGTPKDEASFRREAEGLGSYTRDLALEYIKFGSTRRVELFDLRSEPPRSIGKWGYWHHDARHRTC